MGEGALAYELQEALTQKIAPERSEEIVTGQRLTYEWTFLLTSLYSLQQRDLDQTLQKHPEIVDYAHALTARMADLDVLVSLLAPPEDSYEEPQQVEKIIKLRSLPKIIDIASDTYFAHNGLHETAWRSNRLEAIAMIYDYHLANAPYKVGDRTFVSLASERRLAASVHEELAGHHTGREADRHQEIAYKLNQDIATNAELPWYDQQKVHAQFSLYDIEYRRAFNSIMGCNDAKPQRAAETFAIDTQQRFYADLFERAQYIEDILEIAHRCENEVEKLLWVGRANSLMGTTLEIQVLGEMRDAIIRRNELLSIEARQAYLREDHNPRVHKPHNPKKYIHTPNFSFDIVLQAHGTRGPMSRLNIEVKKAHRAESYLSGTHVLCAQDESSPHQFSANLKQLARAKISYYAGEKLDQEQVCVLANSLERVSPDSHLDEVLNRAF